MSFLLLSTVAASGLGFLGYKLGIFDRPEFAYYETLLPSNDDDDDDGDDGDKNKPQMLYAIIATTKTKDIGSVVHRLVVETKNALSKVATAEAMARPAKLYGAPGDSLSVGLYFDDPNTIDEPKWGIGWAVDADNWEDVKEMERQAQKVFAASSSSSEGPDGKRNENKEIIRAVRIGPGPVLKGRIPWRNSLTPMIAAMLHWGRAFQAYKEGGYKSHNGRKDPKGTIDGQDSAVALEIYLHNDDKNNNSSENYIDYVVLMGDTTNVWNDCFPEEKETGE